MSRTHRGVHRESWTSADFVRGRSRSVDNASRWVRTCGQVRQTAPRCRGRARRPQAASPHRDGDARHRPPGSRAKLSLTHSLVPSRTRCNARVSWRRSASAWWDWGPRVGRAVVAAGWGWQRGGGAARWRGQRGGGQRGGGAARWGWQRGGGAARWGWQRPGGRASSAGAHPGGPQQRPLACQHPGPARARRPGRRSAQGNPQPPYAFGSVGRVFGGCDSGPPGRSGLGPHGDVLVIGVGAVPAAARRPTSADQPYVTLRGEAAQADSCSVKKAVPAGWDPTGRARPGAVERSTAAISSSPSQKCRAFSTADATVGTMPSSRNAGMKQTINGSTLRTPTRRAASST